MSLDAKLLLWAIAVQAVLALVLTFWMAIARGRDFRAGLHPQSVALREPKFSPHATKISNAFANQFELPLLFYVVSILFLLVFRPDIVIVALAWAFVILRIVHAFIHTTSNNVMIRGPVFGLGLLVLTLMWIYFVANLVAVPAA
jgi:hypothetical protein